MELVVRFPPAVDQAACPGLCKLSPSANYFQHLQKQTHGRICANFIQNKAQRSQVLEFIFVIKFDNTLALPTTHLMLKYYKYYFEFETKKMLSRYIYELATKDAPLVRRTLSNTDISATRTRNQGMVIYDFVRKCKAYINYFVGHTICCYIHNAYRKVIKICNYFLRKASMGHHLLIISHWIMKWL